MVVNPVIIVIAVLVVWQSFPFIAVSVLAGLKTIPTELLEAARVDGASPWRVFSKITYPLLKPIFLVLLLLSVIWDFNIFAQTYIVTGFPGNQNEYNLSTYLYDKAFASLPPSYGLRQGSSSSRFFGFGLRFGELAPASSPSLPRSPSARAFL